MAKSVQVRDVFKSFGQPEATYVERDHGKYENTLSSALDARGRICLLTGPSKTGKTTLYRKVLAEENLEPIVVRCDASISATELWKISLEEINFERLSSIQRGKGRKASGTGKVGGKIGWTWLASLVGETSVGIDSSMNDLQIRERILSQPAPKHLIPILKELPAVLVVETFHFLRADVKANIFQQWKVFVDSEVSVIVVGTTHHAVDLAYTNRDLVGRISQVDLSTWSSADLEKIAIQGFEFLGIRAPRSVTPRIAQECAGLPIIAQEACYRLLADKGLREIRRGDKAAASVSITEADVFAALHAVATTNYGQFEAIYERLITHSGKEERRRNNYELLLSTFAQDPLAFSLSRHEIDERLQRIPSPRNKQRPTTVSVTSTLNELASFQDKTGVELLEWSNQDQRLYILQPAFLFYLRWREGNHLGEGTSLEKSQG